MSSIDANNVAALDTVNIQKNIEGSLGTQLFEPLESLISAPVADSLVRITVPVLIAKGMLSQEKTTV